MLFHEIYSTYFQTVAKILTEAVDHPLTSGEIDSIVREYAFDESTLEIIERGWYNHSQKKADDAPYDSAEALDQCSCIRSKDPSVYGSSGHISRCRAVISSGRYICL